MSDPVKRNHEKPSPYLNNNKENSSLCKSNFVTDCRFQLVLKYNMISFKNEEEFHSDNNKKQKQNSNVTSFCYLR